MSGSIIYSSRIKAVHFSVSGDSDIIAESAANIVTHDLFKNSQPYEGGVYDGHLGTNDHTYACSTCFNNKKNCTGHDGHMQFNFPVYSPLYFPEVKKWLRLICFKCGNSIINGANVAKVPMDKRLDEASKMARTGVKHCPICKDEHAIVAKDALRPLMIITKMSNGAEGKLYPNHVKNILDKISNETVAMLGKDPIKAHPRKFILTKFKIPSVTIRPDTKKGSTGRNDNNETTTLIQTIIRRNAKLPAVIPEEINEQLSNDIFALQDIVYAYVRGSTGKRIITTGGNKQIMSLASRLKGKQGQHRKHQLGKRVRVVARTTITGDPTRKIDEVGIPLKFAKILQIEEIVQEFNRAELTIYFLNGKKKYPGCSKIIRKATGTEHSVEDPYNMPELQVGDRIFRDLITGDVVLYNRQPSLLPSSISGMTVVVITNPAILTFTMNVIACPLFNADFDGDQMNVYVGRNLASRIEIKRHSGIHNWFIKHASSGPMIGQVDDSIIGGALLTRNNIMINKYNAMQMFNTCTYLPTFTKQIYTSRDIISMHLADTPINFKRKPTWFQTEIAPYIDYDPSDLEVVIERGVLKRGILDKKSVGKGAIGGINHIIASQYGETKAIESLYNMQQLALNYLAIRGFSIGIKDILIDKTALDAIHVIEASIIDKSRYITERLNDGKIIPPVGKTTEQFYEEEQIAVLRVMDDFAEPIFRSIDIKSNNLSQLVLSGSKGTASHIYHISSAIGQIVINDQRPKEQYAYKRTFPHFSRFALDPPARGFIMSSYIGGMNATEFAYNSQNARADFITKVLFTSVTGESERKSIKNLESLVINNHRMCVKYNNVVQLLYGEDGIDTRRMVEVTIPTVLISDKALADGFSHAPGLADSKLAPIFTAEFEELKRRRDEHRDVIMRLERCKFNEPLTATKFMSIDIDKLIIDTIYSYGEQKPTTAEIAAMVTKVSDFTKRLPYTMLNDICEKNNLPIPEHMQTAHTAMVYYILSTLNSQSVLRKFNNAMLSHCLATILRVQLRALCSYGTAVGIIAAMSFSEPLTQYMLDAHHRTTTGGTSKSAMTNVKEVLGARPKEKLSAPSMVLIPLDPNTNINTLTRIANNIETCSLKTFVSKSQIFYEKYGQIIHPAYTHEQTLIETFEQRNPAIRKPADLLRWCIRIVINGSTIIYKNMTMETIVNAIRDKYPDIHCVYSTETSKVLVIRIYIRNTYFKTAGNTSAVTCDNIEALRDTLLDTKIRGTPDILSASVVKLMRSEKHPDGSIMRSNNSHCIVTNGTNLPGAFAIAEIDPYTVQTDSIDEIQQVLGIEAARQKLFTSIRNLGAGGLNMHHVSIYVDEMTYTGVVTSIEKQGLSKREKNNILLRMGFSSPLKTLEEAAINSMEDPVQGVTSPLLIGDIPLSIGTAYNEFHINENMIKQNTIRSDDFLDAL